MVDYQGNSSFIKNMNVDKNKLISVLMKLIEILELNSHFKIVQTRNGKIIYTKDFSLILNSLNIPHPIGHILRYFVEKLARTGPGLDYFIEFTKSMVKEFIYVLESGFSNVELVKGIGEISVCEKQIGGTDGSANYSPMEIRRFISHFTDDDCLGNLLMNLCICNRELNFDNVVIIRMKGSSHESSVKNGLVLPNSLSSLEKSAYLAKVCLFDCPFEIPRPIAKATAKFEKADQLLTFRKDEVEKMKSLIYALPVNAVVVHGSIDSVVLDLLNSRNIVVLRIFDRKDLARIQKISGGKIFTNLFDEMTGKQFSPEDFGFIEEISEFSNAGKNYTMVTGNSSCDTPIKTLVLKHSLDVVLEEMERDVLRLFDCLSEKPKLGKSLTFDRNAMQIKNNGTSVISEIVYKLISKLSDNLTSEDFKYSPLPSSLSRLCLDEENASQEDLTDNASSTTSVSNSFHTNTVNSNTDSVVATRGSSISMVENATVYDKSHSGCYSILICDQVKCTRLALELLRTLISIDDYVLSITKDTLPMPRRGDIPRC